jgi:ribosomal protein S13
MFLSKRIFSKDISFSTAFHSIYGLGFCRILLLAQKLGRSRFFKLGSLSASGQLGLSSYISRYTTDFQLKKISLAILTPHFLFGSYKGIRMRQGMPSNGQRTHTNASTSRAFIRTSSLLFQAYRGSLKRKA